jgi:hypothetical protein
MFVFFDFFYPASVSLPTKQRAAQAFSVLSVITGSEIVTKAELPNRKDRGIADYRKSPVSRLLILND